MLSDVESTDLDQTLIYIDDLSGVCRSSWSECNDLLCQLNQPVVFSTQGLRSSGA